MTGKAALIILLLASTAAQGARLGELVGTSFGRTSEGQKCVVTVSHPGRVHVEIRTSDLKMLGNFPSTPFQDQLAREAVTLIVDDIEGSLYGYSRTIVTLVLDPDGHPRKAKLQRDKSTPGTTASKDILECGSLRLKGP